MAFAGIIIGLLLIFAGIWLFAMSVFFNGMESGFVEPIRLASPFFVIGLLVFILSYLFARKNK